MKHTIKYLALTGSVALLAACGGGGGDSTVNTFAQLEADARAAATGYIDPDSGDFLAAERTSLPAAGSASYAGYVGGEVDGAGLIGELSLDVTFAAGDTGTITGSADSFQHETDGAYTGTLNLVGGQVLADQGLGGEDYVAGTLDGNLTNGGTVYATNIGLDGSFMGGTGTDTPDAIAGYALGNVGTGPGSSFDGIFIVTQP